MPVPPGLRNTAIPIVASAVCDASAYVARSTVTQPAALSTAAALASTALSHGACGAMPTSVAFVCEPSVLR